MMADTPNLASGNWTKHGKFLQGDVWDSAGGDFGAFSVGYFNGPDGSPNARWLFYDGDSVSGYRLTFWAWAKQTSPGVWGPFVKQGPYNYPKKAVPYETVTVFGACVVGPFDRGDGNGNQVYVNLTGQNSPVVGVTVNSALGLGYMAEPVLALQPGVITAGTITTTTIAATATDATGGAGGYTYQWARRLTGVGSYVNVAGQTTLNLADTGLTPGTAYDYRLTYTDSASNAVTAFLLNVETLAGASTALQQKFMVGVGVGLK
jgi:hypothetical protein